MHVTISTNMLCSQELELTNAAKVADIRLQFEKQLVKMRQQSRTGSRSCSRDAPSGSGCWRRTWSCADASR